MNAQTILPDDMEMAACPTCGRVEEKYIDRDSDQCPECYMDDNDNDR